MEIGKLKAQLREKGFNARIPLILPGHDKILWVVVQKSSLMEELDKVFPTKVSETGLMFSGENLTIVKGAVAAPPKAAPETIAALEDSRAGVVTRADSIDDLLADDDDDLLGGPAAEEEDEDLLG